MDTMVVFIFFLFNEWVYTQYVHFEICSCELYRKTGKSEKKWLHTGVLLMYLHLQSFYIDIYI
jgi:hypothetical protein